MRISDAELKTLLLESDKVKPDALKDVEGIHEQTGESLLTTVLKRKLISEQSLLKLYAKNIDVPYADLHGIKIPHDILTKIPERIARKYQAVLFGKTGSTLQLAMADPEDFQAADFIVKQIGQNIKIYVASVSDIMTAIDQYKGNISSEITQAIKDSGTDEEVTQEVSAKDIAEDAPIAKTVNIILEYAIKARASDVHIEPRENIVQVRFRVDGVLRETMTLPKAILPAVVSRIKILSNLKIDEHRMPQDGRFKFSVGSRTVALRISTLPVMDGEKVAVRILDESARARKTGSFANDVLIEHRRHRVLSASAAFTAELAWRAPSTETDAIVARASSGVTSWAIVARPSTLMCSISPACCTASRSSRV